MLSKLSDAQARLAAAEASGGSCTAEAAELKAKLQQARQGWLRSVFPAEFANGCILSCRRHQTYVLPSVYAHLQLVSGQLLHASKFTSLAHTLAHAHVLPPLQLEDSVSSSDQAAADLAAKLEATQAQLAAAPDAATVEQIKVGTRRLSLPEGA